MGLVIMGAIDHQQFPVEGRQRLGQRRHPRRHDAIGLRPLARDVAGTQLLQRLAARIQREQRDAREGGPAFAQPQAGDQRAQGDQQEYRVHQEQAADPEPLLAEWMEERGAVGRHQVEHDVRGEPDGGESAGRQKIRPAPGRQRERASDQRGPQR
ncbi:hypothetical protein D3C80_1474520 [compost metagenome]